MVVYNWGQEVRVDYSAHGTGRIVSVTFERAPKIRNIWNGLATLQFAWHGGGGKIPQNWYFVPSFIDKKSASHTVDPLPEGSVRYDVEQSYTQPMIGLVKVDEVLLSNNFSGIIMAPAIKFDIRFDLDVWIFLLSLARAPLSLSTEKPTLKISHGKARASIQLKGGEHGIAMTTDVNSTVEFNGIDLFLKRAVETSSSRDMLEFPNETLARLDEGTKKLAWRPTVREMNDVLVVNSNTMREDFCSFLAAAGAKVTAESTVKENFVLSDGPGIKYSLHLAGHRHLFGDVRDETKILFTKPQE